MSYDPRDIFNTANSFDEATRALAEKLAKTNDVGTYMAPIITLSSFSVELYLKCIYFIEQGKPALKTHRLDKLYESLSEGSQMVIRLIYDVSVKHDPLVQTMLRKVPSAKVDLLTVLNEFSDAFEKWRYSHHKEFHGFHASGPLIKALKARIGSLKPDWK